MLRSTGPPDNPGRAGGVSPLMVPRGLRGNHQGGGRPPLAGSRRARHARPSTPRGRPMDSADPRGHPPRPDRLGRPRPGAERGGVLREGSPPRPRGALPGLPQRPEAQGRAETDLAVVPAGRRRGGPGGRRGEAGGEPDRPGDPLSSGTQDAPQGEARRPRGRGADEVGRPGAALAGVGREAGGGRGAGQGVHDHRGAAPVLVVPARPRPGPAGGQGRRVAEGGDRPLPPGRAGGEGAPARPAGRPADADPPRYVRPHRPAADPRGGRRLPQRSRPRGVREGHRAPARLPPVRRALGPALAGRGPVRRLAGRAGDRRRGRHRGSLAVSGLGHRRLQSRPAVRPIRPRPGRGGPGPGRRARRVQRRRPGRHGAAGHRRMGHRRRRQGEDDDGHRRRPDRRRRPRLPRPDPRLRPLPRSQVRPDPDGRLLRPGGHLPQHPHPARPRRQDRRLPHAPHADRPAIDDRGGRAVQGPRRPA